MNVKSIDKLTLKELTELNAKVTAAIEPAKQRAKQEILAEMGRVAEARGLSVRDILGKPSRVKQIAPRDVVRYKHPTTGATWSGRGRPPRWIEGKEKDQFAVGASQPK